MYLNIMSQKVSKSKKVLKDIRKKTDVSKFPKLVKHVKVRKERQKSQLVHKRDETKGKFNPDIYTSPFVVNGSKTQFHRYEGEFTREEVFIHCFKLSKKLKTLSPNSQFKVTLIIQEAKDGVLMDKIGYRSGDWKDAGEKPDLWDGQEYDSTLVEGIEGEGNSYQIIGFEYHVAPN